MAKGDKIPNSRFYRNYCCECGAPMRVDYEGRFDNDWFCEDCLPYHKGCTSPKRRVPLDDPNEFSSSWKM